ncbi:MAG TPA: permease [Micromonosporaceae bacterium]|nr:permease [Micromonosporaceae bacterium]
MYQCTRCNSPADPIAGCPTCGAPPPPLAVEIDRLNREIAEMSSRDLAIQRERAGLSSKMQAALHQRNLLMGAQSERLRRTPKQRSAARRVGSLLPANVRPRLRGGRTRQAEPDSDESGRGTAPDTTTEAGPGVDTSTATRPGTARSGGARPGSTPGAGSPPGTGRATGTAGGGGQRAAAAGGRPRAAPTRTMPSGPVLDDLAAEPLDADETGLRPEASSRSVQNVLLGLGALLLGVAAAVFIAVATSVLEPVSRAAILAVATGLILLVPPVLARRALTSTAETVCMVGLALLPLTGYAVWEIDPLRTGVGLPGPVFAALVLGATSAVAAGYRAVAGLVTPTFVAVLAAQPVLPLLAYPWIRGAAGWALVLAGVAALDVALARVLAREEPSASGLRELIWVLHGLAVGAALVYAMVALVTAGGLAAVTRAGAVLVIAAAVGLAGALSLRRRPLPDVAAGIMVLAVLGSAVRVLAAALPGRSLVLFAAILALIGLGLRLLPPAARRGPQLAASIALAVLGLVVAGFALRATIATLRAALPVWEADVAAYPGRLAAAVGPGGWQIATAAALLTLAAVVAVPPAFQREATAAGAAVAVLAAPASYGLSWSTTPWVLLAGAVGFGIVGLAAPTERAARVLVGAALLVGLAAATASLARPELTAWVLMALALAGGVIGLAPHWATGGPHANITTDAALGGAAAALPGAAATSVVVTVPSVDAVPVLAAAFLAVSVSLGYAALIQVAQRRTNVPLAAGGSVGAAAVTVAAFTGDGAEIVDILVALSLLVGAALLWFAPSIDASQRADRWIEGPDVAAAAVTAGAIGALARISASAAPGTGLATTAALVLIVAIGVRAMPERWRPGPVVGCAIAGAVVAVMAGTAAVVGGLRVLVATSPVWAADLSTWAQTVEPGRMYGWQTPYALLLLAAAAAVALPPRSRNSVVPATIGLAVVAAPAALQLPWWSPILLGMLAAGGFGLAAVVTRSHRAGIAWAGAAGAMAGYAVGASLVGPWATAGALVGVAAVAALIATSARVAAADRADHAAATRSHLEPVGGAAVAAALLAGPAAVATLAAALDHPATTALPAAFAATAIGLSLVAAVARGYLPYAAVGTAAAATAIAIAAVFTGQPLGVYAAAAAMLGVIAEMHRAAVTPPDGPAPRLRARWRSVWRSGQGRLVGDTGPAPGEPAGAGLLTPGLLAAAGIPALLAVVSIGPALTAALLEPYRTLRHIWQGPGAAGVDWAGYTVGDRSSTLAALVLTIAAALAALGFGDRSDQSRDELAAQVVPVLLPGVAITLLIAPYSLHLPWPVGTVAALTVFVISMLGVALSPPPPPTEAARPVRVTRYLVVTIGLAAGGAGLAGSLATRSTTLVTLAGAVVVGIVAALRGTTSTARVLGWGFASVSAHFLAYVTGLAMGLAPHWSSFGVLGVSAIVLVTAATLPQLSRPENRGQAAALEWSGYIGALVSLVLAAGSVPHLAALLAAWGAVLGVAAVRPGRPAPQRRTLLWVAAAFELVAWWLLARTTQIEVPEAYTLPFAALALVVGVIELRHHPELGSWGAYGVALIAAFGPSLVIVLVTDSGPLRRTVLLVAAATTLALGSLRRQRAPVVIGGVVTTVAAVHELFLASVWLVLIPLGVLLLALGATNEKRQREMQRLRGALNRMR